MNRHSRAILLVGAVACLIVAPCAVIAKPVAGATATWTYAIFGNADNDLEKYWDSKSLPWLKLVPASASVNIVVLLDRQSTSTTEVLRINGGVVTVVETHGEMDMGDPTVLTWWINRATTLFPSTYFAMTLWDHGYGWKYISHDFTSGNRISMLELQSAIANAGKRIDVLAFDACNMANAEVVYQVAKTNLVTYLVGSEEVIPGDGFPYDKMLTRLVNNPVMTPRELSIALIDGWGDYYKTQRWATTVNLAAIDVEGLEASIGTFTTWSARMMELLPTYKSRYATALKNAHTMWGTSYFVDTYDYGYTLLVTKGVTDPALRTATQNMMNAIPPYVVKVWNASKMTDCMGITIYWGVSSDWSSSKAEYMTLSFSVDTGWGNFLTAYNL